MNTIFFDSETMLLYKKPIKLGFSTRMQQEMSNELGRDKQRKGTLT